nr:MAG TPA: hypothetical protein [Caudoviricetes sp.]
MNQESSTSISGNIVCTLFEIIYSPEYCSTQTRRYLLFCRTVTYIANLYLYSACCSF